MFKNCIAALILLLPIIGNCNDSNTYWIKSHIEAKRNELAKQLEALNADYCITTNDYVLVEDIINNTIVQEKVTNVISKAYGNSKALTYTIKKIPLRKMKIRKICAIFDNEIYRQICKRYLEIDPIEWRNEFEIEYRELIEAYNENKNAMTAINDSENTEQTNLDLKFSKRRQALLLELHSQKKTIANNLDVVVRRHRKNMCNKNMRADRTCNCEAKAKKLEMKLQNILRDIKTIEQIEENNKQIVEGALISGKYNLKRTDRQAEVDHSQDLNICINKYENLLKSVKLAIKTHKAEIKSRFDLLNAKFNAALSLIDNAIDISDDVICLAKKNVADENLELLGLPTNKELDEDKKLENERQKAEIARINQEKILHKRRLELEKAKNTLYMHTVSTTVNVHTNVMIK